MKRVFSLIVAMFFLTLLFHGQAAKANSISVLDSGTIEFQDADGDGFRDRDPNPIKEEITDIGAKPDLIGGAPLNPDGVVSSEPLGTLNGASAEGISAPTINLWYGQNQSFGSTGQPQRFVNILGNIDSTKLQNVTATYSLNGGAAQPLSLGADPYRLAEAGDFNVELATSDLNVGANSVKIVADDGEETAELTVNFTYTNVNVWPINTTVNWTNNTLRNSAQVVDGQWTVENGTIRPLVFDYDRMVTLGDMTWEDYEVTVPIKINSYDDSGFNGPANGAAVGVVVRWQGHLSDGNQPSINWRNLGALGWYRWAPSGAEGFEMRGNGGGYIQSNSNITLDFGTQYMFKMSVQSVDGEPTSYYRFKFWEATEDEPVDWLLEGYGLGADNGNGIPAEPATGSVALLAHHVDANFGQVKVEPLNDIDPTLTTESSANGSVYVSPPGDYETTHEYDYSDKVTVTS